MAAAATDKFQEVGINTATTLDAPGYTIGGTSVTVASTANMPTATGITFAMDVIDSDGVQVPGSYNEYVGTVATGTSITNVSHANGTDRNYSAGATTRVYLPVSAERENRLVEGLLVEHDQDGTHGTLANLTVTNAPTFTIGGAIYKVSHYYTYDGTDIFVDGVDQNNAANTINWTKPTGLKFIVVEVQAGGGGGGSSGSTNDRRGAGGGGGGYARKKIVVASLGATEVVTVGGGGAAGAAGGNNTGATGGTSSLGAHVSATGGVGGAGGATGTDIAGGAGGTSATGDMSVTGMEGFHGGTLAFGVGAGGHSVLGFPGVTGNVGNAAGVAGQTYGGGGSGGGRSSAGDNAGGAGAAGIVIVHEYY